MCWNISQEFGNSLVLWNNNTYKENYFPTRSVLEPVEVCHIRFANKLQFN